MGTVLLQCEECEACGQKSHKRLIGTMIGCEVTRADSERSVLLRVARELREEWAKLKASAEDSHDRKLFQCAGIMLRHMADKYEREAGGGG